MSATKVSSVFTPKHANQENFDLTSANQVSPQSVQSPSLQADRYSSVKPTYPVYSSDLYYNDRKLKQFETENYHITNKISQTVQDSQVVASKLHSQTQDIDNLSHNVDNKQTEWITLNNDLDKQIEEANKYLSSQKEAFVVLENVKVDSHIDMVNKQASQVNDEQALEDRNKALFVKINELEGDMQDQIKNWKLKYAHIKEANQNDLADLTKNYTDKLIVDDDTSYKKEENYKKISENNENEVWKLKYDGDLHLKQIYNLSNELKLRKENVKNAEEKLNHVAKEINNEKEMMLQEDLRQSNNIKEYASNQADMIDIHNKTLADLESKVKELENRKNSHKLAADKNQRNLENENNVILDEIKKETRLHEVKANNQNREIKDLNQEEIDLINKKNQNNLIVEDLNNFIDEDRSENTENMTKARNDNESVLTEREYKIQSLSESVTKLQQECALNIEEIRNISNDKNELVN